MDWQDVFEGVIPIDRLMDAFTEAMRVHAGTFPVNAFEILDAWKAIKPPPETDWERMKRIENWCIKCGDTGFEIVRDGNYSAAKPCDLCEKGKAKC